jgi:hypothetical protein
MHNKEVNQSQDNVGEDLFAEKFVKVSFRDFSNNTRMDIKNVDLKNQQQKRDRMLSYWQNNVSEKFLPPINYRKKTENEPGRAKTAIGQMRKGSTSSDDVNGLS